MRTPEPYSALSPGKAAHLIHLPREESREGRSSEGHALAGSGWEARREWRTDDGQRIKGP